MTRSPWRTSTLPLSVAWPAFWATSASTASAVTSILLSRAGFAGAVPAVGVAGASSAATPLLPGAAPATFCDGHGGGWSAQATGIMLPSATIAVRRSEEHTSELQSRRDLVCRLLLEK